MRTDVLDMTERQAIQKLVNTWKKVDLIAKDYMTIEIALNAAASQLDKNPHWTRLKDTVSDIVWALNCIRKGKWNEKDM